MRLMRVLASAALALAFSQTDAVAQSDPSARVPAEFPPASYTGRQYVDSRGCVFIRAGIDGQVTWVPRVSRERKVICGFKPSLPTAAAKAQPAAPAQPKQATQPTIITVPKQTAVATKPAAKPKPAAKAPAKVVRKAPEPKPAAATPAPKPVVAAPKPAKAPKPAPKPAAKPARVAQNQPACQDASPLSQRYLQSMRGFTVRCGPQTQPHATIITGGGGSGTVTYGAPPAQPVIRSTGAPVQVVTPQPTRVAPRHVYEGQISSTQGIYVPEGYQLVWDDDRLNPRRAHQTFEGKAMMELAWTKTVPRRLIDRRTGREVSHNYPGLQYPYTSFAQQEAAGEMVATRGQMVPDPIRVVRATDGTLIGGQPSATRTRKAAPSETRTSQVRQTISTRSAAPKTAAKAASHRYVQIGLFSAPDKAKAAAQRLANAGLPARMGSTTHKGKTYTSVVVGPYKTQAQLDAGLRAVRRVGYANASLRK